MSDLSVKKAIHDAVWLGHINQISTREVATMFNCNITVARRILLNIVNNRSGDERFKPDTTRDGGAIISNNRTFDYSEIGINGGSTASKNEPTHYIWFVS